MPLSLTTATSARPARCDSRPDRRGCYGRLDNGRIAIRERIYGEVLLPPARLLRSRPGGVRTAATRALQRLVLDAAAFQGMVLWTSALSGISRNLGKLLRALDFLIAHNVTVLTTNYMIRSDDVWVRHGASVRPVSNAPAACLPDCTGLSGAHKKAYEQVAKQVVQPRPTADALGQPGTHQSPDVTRLLRP